jgi:hypothetical protein
MAISLPRLRQHVVAIGWQPTPTKIVMPGFTAFSVFTAFTMGCEQLISLTSVKCERAPFHYRAIIQSN